MVTNYSADPPKPPLARAAKYVFLGYLAIHVALTAPWHSVTGLIFAPGFYLWQMAGAIAATVAASISHTNAKAGFFFAVELLCIATTFAVVAETSWLNPELYGEGEALMLVAFFVPIAQMIGVSICLVGGAITGWRDRWRPDL